MAETMTPAAVAGQIQSTCAEESIQDLVLTGYHVTYIDLREPKPRQQHTELFPVDSTWIRAANLLGWNVLDTIEKRYEKGGYVVLDIRKEPHKRCISLNMRSLWEAAGPLHKDPEKAPEASDMGQPQEGSDNE